MANLCPTEGDNLLLSVIVRHNIIALAITMTYSFISSLEVWFLPCAPALGLSNVSEEYFRTRYWDVESHVDSSGELGRLYSEYGTCEVKEKVQLAFDNPPPVTMGAVAS